MNKFFEALVGENTENKNIFTPLLGEWEIEWVDGKGTENERHVIGEWLFSEILNGEGIQDVFICPSRTERIINPQPDAEYGTTIRIYNPKKQKWDICYACLGKMVYLEAEKVNDEIILTNKSETENLNLWIFSDITADTFHWENKTSFDKGATWIINGEVYAKRKI
ncbi:hypothetical protein HMPREF1142_1937 [Peptostreptococcaceae bacterium AS15]|nr:hypothetical protein HMPREF1142_1937 [Peptostreptococcaceae bacterium AS15]